MTSLDKILSRITILYYIFIVVIMIDFAYCFGTGFVTGFNEGRQSAQEMALSDPQNFVLITIWSFVAIAIYIYALVLFVLLLISLGRSIATKNIFNPRTIKLINRYAMVYAISMLALFTNQLLVTMPTPHVHEGILALLSSASTIIMLLLFAQVLKIGNILKAEQDLTI